MLAVSVLGSLAFLLSVGLTKVLIRYSQTLGMIDTPNLRSSHVAPTPKGGGLGFSIVFTVVAVGFYFLYPSYESIVLPLIIGGPWVVVLGWVDDRFHLSPSFRLLVHLLVALLILGLVTQGFEQPLTISFLPTSWWVVGPFTVLFIAWFINLYNFMDGADGLASSTAISGSVVMGVVSAVHGSPELAMIYALIAYSVGGFLVFNWSPAKIFMGDTGSYFIGFLFASLALIGKAHANVSFYSHIIIFGFFICDTTYILFYRFFTGKPLFKAHRSFTFHKLMKQGWGHRRISAFYSLVLILWLFPLANLASTLDNKGLLIVAVAYLPLLGFGIYLKAGEE